jgi:hypothetical protein
MLGNPFTRQKPAAPPRAADRRAAAGQVAGLLRASRGASVALCGPLGSGKTGLLRELADPGGAARLGLVPPAFQPAYLDMQSVAPFTAHRFWQRLARVLGRQGGPAAGAFAPLLELCAIDVSDVEDALDGLAGEGTTLVLLLDEFEWALVGGDDGSSPACLPAQLASLLRRQPRSLALVAATAEPLAELAAGLAGWRGSPFASLFVPLALGRPALVPAPPLVAAPAGPIQTAHLPTGGPPAGPWPALDPAADEATAEPDAGPAGPGLHMGVRTGEVWRDGDEVPALTALECNVLRVLFSDAGRLWSKDEILAHVWGDGDADTTRLEKVVSRLRQKIEPDPARPRFLATVRGRGYRILPAGRPRPRAA